MSARPQWRRLDEASSSASLLLDGHSCEHHNEVDLESELDRLYQLPLEEFTKARNLLAKALTGSTAQRVKSLTKPSLPAWAVNQLYWQARPTYAAMIDAAEHLRGAQRAVLEGRSTDVGKAQDVHRTALRAGTDKAAAILTSSGRPSSSGTLDVIRRTLEALPKQNEAPGRLMQALEPGGFELLTGITPRAPAEGDPPKAKPDVRDVREAQRTLRETEAAVELAKKRLERARAEEAKVQQALARATEARLNREGEVEQLQTAAERARGALKKA